jgi:hypothetical protein
MAMAKKKEKNEGKDGEQQEDKILDENELEELEDEDEKMLQAFDVEDGTTFNYLLKFRSLHFKFRMPEYDSLCALYNYPAIYSKYQAKLASVRGKYQVVHAKNRAA